MWGRDDNKMRGWSKISDFDKIFICLFIVSYPLHLVHSVVYLRTWYFGVRGRRGRVFIKSYSG